MQKSAYLPLRMYADFCINTTSKVLVMLLRYHRLVVPHVHSSAVIIQSTNCSGLSQIKQNDTLGRNQSARHSIGVQVCPAEGILKQFAQWLAAKAQLAVHLLVISFYPDRLKFLFMIGFHDHRRTIFTQQKTYVIGCSQTAKRIRKHMNLSIFQIK